jgi:hypothetical protein
MRRAVLLLCFLVLFATGCGDGDDETTGQTATGPRGELSETAIGAAEEGASTAEVEELFGAPDQEDELPGCELAGPNATPVLQWIWNLEDGSASIDFDAATEKLMSYRTSSSDLPTTNGARVGDSFEALRGSYGPTLKPLDLGVPSTEREGPWYVGDPAKSWLLFTVAGGKIKTIQGGNLTICE